MEIATTAIKMITIVDMTQQYPASIRENPSLICC